MGAIDPNAAKENSTDNVNGQAGQISRGSKQAEPQPRSVIVSGLLDRISMPGLLKNVDMDTYMTPGLVSPVERNTIDLVEEEPPQVLLALPTEYDLCRIFAHPLAARSASLKVWLPNVQEYSGSVLVSLRREIERLTESEDVGMEGVGAENFRG